MRKVENFLKQLFAILFLTLIKQLFNILATKTKNCNHWPFLTKDMKLLTFALWPFQAKLLGGGIFYNFFVFACTSTLKPSHCTAFWGGILNSFVTITQGAANKKGSETLSYMVGKYDSQRTQSCQIEVTSSR